MRTIMALALEFSTDFPEPETSEHLDYISSSRQSFTKPCPRLEEKHLFFFFKEAKDPAHPPFSPSPPIGKTYLSVHGLQLKSVFSWETQKLFMFHQLSFSAQLKTTSCSIFSTGSGLGSQSLHRQK